MAKSVTIQHPKDDKPTHHPIFIAFGPSQGVTHVKGKLVGKTSGKSIDGNPVLQPKGTNGFWMIQFQVQPGGKTEKYKLSVYDADGDPNQPLATSDRIDAEKDGPPANSIVISYPHAGSPDCPLPLEFACYGTTDGTASMSATLSCPGFSAEQSVGPPNWGLHCSLSSKPSGSCDLTVSETGETSQQSKGLTFA
jgi:hypothetical protein